MATMSPGYEHLTATEAAVVAHVSVRDINRAIDEHILPSGFFRVGAERNVAAAGCPLIAFYFGSAERLTSKERLWAIERAGPRLKMSGAFGALLAEDWIFRDEFLAIDLAPFVRATAKRLDRLVRAREVVEVSPDVLGGTPVIRGTRVPVYDVAASVAAGITHERILAGYPSLDAEMIELASIYAQATPPRGRPRHAAGPPKGAKVVTDRRIRIRRKAK
jgi:uncharacterized protein (DUF433 family)